MRALIRLSENPDTGWDELNAALLRERSLRGRLFSVLGSSLALGDHLVAHPQSWKLLRGKVTLPSHDQLQRSFVECVEESEGMPGSLVHRLRTQYRDYVLMLAALDLAATVEDEPVLPFTVVAARLADAADALWRRRCAWPRRACAASTRHRAWRSSRWASAVRAN